MSTVVLLAAVCCGQASLPKPLVERALALYAIDDLRLSVRPRRQLGLLEERAWTSRCANAALHRGRSLADIGRYREAILAFDEALSHDYRLAEAYVCRNQCHEQLGDRAKALADLRLVIYCPCTLAQQRWWAKVSNDFGDVGAVIANLSVMIDEECVCDADLYCSRG